MQRRTLGLVGAACVALSLVAATPQRAVPVEVLIRVAPQRLASVDRSLSALGGIVEDRYAALNVFKAQVSMERLAAVRQIPGVLAITTNARVHLLDNNLGFDASNDPGSLYNETKFIGAQNMWKGGYTGKGVDVALLDTGVVPVNGLTSSGKIVNGIDVSFDQGVAQLRYLDGYGHGTHMAGIIAGRDDGLQGVSDYASQNNFVGVAPDARLINVKLGDANGIVDVSQVLAAIDWIIEHRNDNGMNIRVLNLSFGTDSAQPYTLDPLAYAAEVAWRRGIVVVAAAGNNGTSLGRLEDPADDPYVIAVGADDTSGTQGTSDDTVPSWSSRGDGVRNPDLVAPGKSIVSLRDVGSTIDNNNPSARVGTRFFRGSGTSQATAMVSGAAALLLQQRPGLTPDQVKKLLVSTAAPIPNTDATAAGAGLLNLRGASSAATPSSIQQYAASTGTGTLEAARGSAHVAVNGVALTGEMDIFGNAWNAGPWATAAAAGTTWSGGQWNGTTWSGTSWSGTSWSGTSWSGTSWSGTSWAGTSWSGTSWSGTSWSGTSWSGSGWTGTSWSGTSWSGTSWSGTSWSGTSWSGTTWSTGGWLNSIWGDPPTAG